MDNLLFLCDSRIQSFPCEKLNNVGRFFFAFAKDDKESETQISEDLSKHLNCIVEIVNLPDLFNRKALAIRDDYINWVDSRGKENPELRDMFQFRGVRVNFWYFSLFCEKNTLKSNAFYHLALMMGLMDFIDEHQIKKVYLHVEPANLWTQDFRVNLEKRGVRVISPHEETVEKEPLSAALGSLYGIFRYIFFVYVIKLYFYVLKLERKKINENNLAMVVTYFPFLNRESLQENKFVNTHYKDLQKALEKMYMGRLNWVGMRVSLLGWKFKESMDAVISLKKIRSFDLLEEWISAVDIGRGLCYLVSMKFRFHKISGKFKKAAEFVYGAQKYSVSNIFLNDIVESSTGFTFFQSVIYHLTFCRLAKKIGGNPVIFFCENHAWEKGLCAAFNKSTKIGIQHAGTPFLMNNYFMGKEARKDDFGNRLMPDFVLCSGEKPYQLLKDTGYDQERLSILGAFRFDADVFNVKKENKPWDKRENKVLVATSIMSAETESLARWLELAYGGTNLPVFVKPHPALFLTEKTMAILSRNQNFKLVHDPLEKLCENVKAMIVTESSSCLYALQEGIPVIVCRLVEHLDLSILTGVTDLQTYADDPAQLRKTTTEIMAKHYVSPDVSKGRQFIKSYLSFKNNSDEYIDIMRKAL